MSDLKYEPVYPLSRRELMLQIESGDPRAIANALYAATKYEEDWTGGPFKPSFGLSGFNELSFPIVWWLDGQRLLGPRVPRPLLAVTG